MRKKLTTIILVLAIILQLSVPAIMIAYSKNIEGASPEYGFEGTLPEYGFEGALSEYGKEFKIKVYVQSAYDGVVDYRFYSYDLYDIGRFAVLEEDSEGYVNLATIQKSKPKTPYYIRITMDNKAKLDGFPISSNIDAFRVKEDSAYLVIKAYKGELAVVNLYMDGIPAEEWFDTAIAEEDERGYITLQQKN